ncbi:MAG: glucose-6-phosphate isomerase, partial [Clostridium sp.]|nr:glucose-6-phosphate isomerase [Clostridium sp.]
MVSEQELENVAQYTEFALKTTLEKTGPGNEFLGWVNLPKEYDKEEFTRIKASAEKIKSDSDALVVIGIGGSYLGAKAAIEMLSHTFHNELGKEKTGGVQIYYLGHNMSSDYINDFLEAMHGKDLSVNVISKSGTTTEPAIAFRVMKKYMEDKYGKQEAAKRIYTTTDANKGALKGLVDQEGYESFVVPDSVGGRYSVLTAVGLLPIAAAGIDIDEIMAGAEQARSRYTLAPFAENDCLKYAAARNILYRKGKEIEILVNYEPKLSFFAEWWKQLFGESEGKDGKGIFPAAVNFSTDLHSMGQYIQDGRRNLFETVIQVEEPRKSFEIPRDEANLDGLNFLA